MEVRIQLKGVDLSGDLEVPEKADKLVIFVHGSGSSRLSPRNQMVARELNKAGIATLLFDLLTEKEDENYEKRFDISLLVERISAVIQWCRNYERCAEMMIGLFGGSTGSAAALIAASESGNEIKAVVSRGGRTDLADGYLTKIKASVLLIVGGNDREVLELNQVSMKKISSVKKLEIIPGATHLFEEPGTLEKVAELAKEWFIEYLK